MVVMVGLLLLTVRLLAFGVCGRGGEEHGVERESLDEKRNGSQMPPDGNASENKTWRR